MIKATHFVTVIYFKYRPASWSVAQALPVYYAVIIITFAIVMLKQSYFRLEQLHCHTADTDPAIVRRSELAD
jgi:hypothetical protein